MEAKALSLLSLSRKGRLLEAGEEPVGALCRAGKARLVLVAQDASTHTLRRAQSFVSGTKQPLLTIACTKEELGGAIGRSSCAMAALADPGLALAFVKALEQPPEELLTLLAQRDEKAEKRRSEQRAHEKNVHRKKK